MPSWTLLPDSYRKFRVGYKKYYKCSMAVIDVPVTVMEHLIQECDKKIALGGSGTSFKLRLSVREPIKVDWEDSISLIRIPGPS